MLLKELAKKIRGRREKLGLKQQDIASALNLTPQAVSKWERGENGPDIVVLAPLARLLGVSTDWLLSAYEETRDVFEATVLASSVRGAYEKSLRLEAPAFAAWAKGLFFQLTEVTLRHDGVPIKYMGDQYLCFFAGAGQRERAVRAALEAKVLIAEDVRIGLGWGEIYLGSVGHPDYARPDIMGEVVNITFLTKEWAESHAKTGIAATAAVLDGLTEAVTAGKLTQVEFMGVGHPVEVCEIGPPE